MPMPQKGRDFPSLNQETQLSKDEVASLIHKEVHRQLGLGGHAINVAVHMHLDGSAKIVVRTK
jgi:hypothetical protein